MVFFVLQLFKAVTFEIDHEPKVSFLHGVIFTSSS